MLRLVWMLKLVYSFRILAMDVMPDHIHLLLNCKPQFRISDMVKIMKGNTARWLFLKYPELKQSLWGGRLWNPSCCAVTVSGRSREQVTHYINSQKERAYGWSITSPSDALLEFCVENNLTEIRLNRNDGMSIAVGIGGTHAGTFTGTSVRKPSSTRKYICPCCGMSVRATKSVNIACMDCNAQLELAS